MHKPLLVAKTYETEVRIGQGSFGEIYRGRLCDAPSQKVAIKFEDANAPYQLLPHESKVLQALDPSLEIGIPRVHFFGQEHGKNVMVIDYLGADLSEVVSQHGGKLDPFWVLLVAKQLVARLCYIHSKGYLHRDIKPQNIVMGRPERDKVFLIDFGLSVQYRDALSGVHISDSMAKTFVGTASYASINVLEGKESSRRDDMEALAYVLIYCLKGSLPSNWCIRQDDNSAIAQAKRAVSLSQLCSGLPPEFQWFLGHCRSLRFEQQPDYDGCVKRFQKRINQLQFQPVAKMLVEQTIQPDIITAKTPGFEI